MAIACAGYRVVGQGHHQVSFEAAELAVGARVSNLVAYFELSAENETHSTTMSRTS
jgi:hypothetical protein